MPMKNIHSYIYIFSIIILYTVYCSVMSFPPNVCISDMFLTFFLAYPIKLIYLYLFLLTHASIYGELCHYYPSAVSPKSQTLLSIPSPGLCPPCPWFAQRDPSYHQYPCSSSFSLISWLSLHNITFFTTPPGNLKSW